MFFCLYDKKKNITQLLEDMNFIFSWQKQYFTRQSLRSFVKYCFEIHISVPPCNILFLIVLPTSQVGYHAGKPIENVIYCFYKMTLSFL